MLRILLIVFSIVFCFDYAKAAEPKGYLGLALGRYNALRPDRHEIDFRVEYRPVKAIFLNKIKPWAGLEATSRGTLWAGGGVLTDIHLSPKFILTPSFGAGLYAKGGSPSDLAYPIQFRSQLDFSYIFQNNSRISFSFSHISNASLGNENPGSEIFGLYYYFPLSIM